MTLIQRLRVRCAFAGCRVCHQRCLPALPVLVTFCLRGLPPSFLSYVFVSSADAPAPMEASELTGAAAAKAASVAMSLGFTAALRFVELMVMIVVIRFLACRCCNLLDITLLHLSVQDDADSPIGAALRFFLPRQKGDPLGSNGGAAMRAVSQVPVVQFTSYRYSCFPRCSTHNDSTAISAFPPSSQCGFCSQDRTSRPRMSRKSRTSEH